ncbi:hypothetical protein BX616_000424 [Lobosporangium transversale]|nr:hypothetical protein BX616_000424 [Lobosporangium transversale]
MPHVAFPDTKPFKIVNQKFGDTNQLMIGSVLWNALSTLAVVLTTGKVIVGPHNSFFRSHCNSRLWFKKGAGKDMRNNVVRQTRTNFDDIITYGKHAAVHPRFLMFNAKPVTLADLWTFKASTHGWSGLKVAAFVFKKLFNNCGELLRSEVEERLAMVRRDKGDDSDDTESDRGIRNNLQRLVDVMEEKETRPVSVKVDRELRGLADKANKQLRKINQTVVIAQVERILEGMLH